MSFAWSNDYVKDIIYMEYDITNMSATDTLFDCVMGIYMDADCGPQDNEDVSGYVRGEGYEFAYSRDADGDGGATPGYVGVTLCSPVPEDINLTCWYWGVGNGSNDHYPLNYVAATKTANEKYWLLTDRNPRGGVSYLRLCDENQTNSWFEMPANNPKDTRFLYAIHGRYEDDKNGTVPTAINGYVNPIHSEVWNLLPKQTMKIVVAVFAGNSLKEAMEQANRSKVVYQNPQRLSSITLPDIMPHFEILGSDEIYDDVIYPMIFTINQIYPNPFNLTTNILFTLPEDSMIDISVYNIRGQLVKVIKKSIC